MCWVDLPPAVRAFEIIREALREETLLLVGPKEDDARRCVWSPSMLKSIKGIGKVAQYKDLPGVLPAVDLFLLPYPEKIVNVGR